jgi:hypothetical protein
MVHCPVGVACSFSTVFGAVPLLHGNPLGKSKQLFRRIDNDGFIRKMRGNDATQAKGVFLLDLVPFLRILHNTG